MVHYGAILKMGRQMDGGQKDRWMDRWMDGFGYLFHERVGKAVFEKEVHCSLSGMHSILFKIILYAEDLLLFYLSLCFLH